MPPKYPKIVTSPHYHLWSDALHARELARQANNRWDRGTYVRWTVMTAWTALEMACEHALGATGIGRRFRGNLNAAVAKAGLPPLKWGSGVWQNVLKLHTDRKDFVHLNPQQSKLFPMVKLAEMAIEVIRTAIEAIYRHSGKKPPGWLADDTDPGWDAPRTGPQAHLTAVRKHSGGDKAIRITYVYKDREFETELLPEFADIESAIKQLLENLNVPVSAVRVYRGTKLIQNRALAMRGS